MNLDQRRLVAQTLKGKGVEVCASFAMSPLPTNASAQHFALRTSAEQNALFGAQAPAVDVKLRDLVSSSPALAQQSVDFVILNSPALSASANPLALISAWGDKLKSRGAIMLTMPSRATRKIGHRPTTPLEHIYSDFKHRRTTACDEHLLASAFEIDPNQFPKPAGVGLALAYLWTHALYKLDAHSRRLLGDENSEYFAELCKDPTRQVRHHVFSVRSALGCIDLVNIRTNFRLVPYDVMLGRTTSEEDVLLLRRYEKTFLDSRHGRSSLSESCAMFRRQLASQVQQPA